LVRHLLGQVLTRVLVGGEQDLRLVLVGRDVVGDLDRDQVAALVRLADHLLGHDRGEVLRGRVHLGGQLGEVVVLRVGRREVQRARVGLGRRGLLAHGEPELLDLLDFVRCRGDTHDAVLDVGHGGTGRGDPAALLAGLRAFDLVLGRGALGCARGRTGRAGRQHDKAQRDRESQRNGQSTSNHAGPPAFAAGIRKILRRLPTARHPAAGGGNSQNSHVIRVR
jgi:hypothetical protein